MYGTHSLHDEAEHVTPATPKCLSAGMIYITQIQLSLVNLDPVSPDFA